MRFLHRLVDRSERLLPFVGVILFICLVALTGGTSRPDSLSQALVRAIAAVAIAGWAFAPIAWRNRDLRAAYVLIGCIAALILIQLIPLPPQIWSKLPGRDFYLMSADAAGIAQPWRPISLVPDRTWNSLFVLLVPLAAIVGLSHLSSRRRARLLMPVIAIIMASAILGLAQLSDGQDSALRPYAYSSDRFASGFFANRNHQALLLACALPMLAGWAMSSDIASSARKGRVYVALGLAAFIILMLPTTGSRVGIAVGIIGALGAIAIAMPGITGLLRRISRRQRRRLLTYAAGAGAVFVAVLALFGRNEAIRRLYGLDVAEDLRARTWLLVLDMSGTFFPAGIGLGSFDIVYRRFEPFEHLSYTYLNQAHNDILQVFVEGGALGGAILIAFMIWWMRASWRVWRAAPAPDREAGRAGSVAIGLILIASVFDYPMRTPLMMTILAIAGAWLVTSRQADRPSAD